MPSDACIITFTPRRTQPAGTTYSNVSGIAKFDGPGGFTEIVMTEVQARAISQAFHVDFVDRTHVT